MIGIHIDIDAKKSAEAALAASETRLRAVVDNVPIGIIALGFVVAFVVALVVVRWFIGYVSRQTFLPFAWYRIAVGSAALIWLFVSR